MTTNRSDYNKPRFNINSFLPGQLKNELSTSLFDNLHNRFLTKNDTVYQRGSIGRPSTSSNQSDRFEESDIFRRAYQIQPHIRIKSDANTTAFNWMDVVNRCHQLGIDFDRYAEWGKVKQFNFAPPINPDKLINYRDYYWVKPGNEPEYITIQNVNTSLQAQHQLIQHQLDDTINQMPVDESKVDDLNYQLVITATKIKAANNEQLNWDNRYFDSNGQVQPPLPETSSVVNFGIALTGDVSFWINDVLVEPTKLNGSEATFSFELSPRDTITAKFPWFYSINPGSTPPTLGEYAWFNIDDGRMYRYTSVANTWVVVDQQPIDDIQSTRSNNKNASEQQWSQSNHWVHRQFVGDFSNTTQAKLPIIEYVHGTKLNEYLYVNFNWKYRANPNEQFQSVAFEPSIDELSTRYPIINVEPPINDQTIKISGDHTDTLHHGVVFSVENVSYPYQAVQLTVQEATFVDGVTTIYPTTTIDITLPFPSAVVPISTTSVGDKYRGVHVHWMLDYIDRPISGDVSSLYNPQAKQCTWIVGQGSDISINAKFDEMNQRWYMVTDNIPAHFINNDTFYVDGGAQLFALQIVDSVSFELHNVDTNELYIGNEQQPVTFLATKYRLPDSLSFLGGSGNLRLYINQVRQTDNYYEAVTTQDGLTSSVSFQQPGNTIAFTNDYPSIGDVVYIESHVVSSDDVGRELVLVRRSESDVYQLEQRSLVRYFRYEQVKYEPNQYPLFDLFDHLGNHSGRTSPIWSFDESPEFPANPAVGGRRIRVSNQRKVYHFINDLVDKESGQLFVYKHTPGTTGFKTIWETSGEYVPRLVNDQRQHNGDIIMVDGNEKTVVVDSSNGVWELPDPLFYNPSHELRTSYSTTDVFAHFNSIIRQQNKPLATLINYDYTIGGTIKEHNLALDDWLSSLLASPVSTIDIINFAKLQYTETILNVRNLIIDQYCHTAVTTNTNNSQKQALIQQMIDRMFNTDQLRGRVYGDSDSYDQTYGVPNMIATASRFGLWPTYRPYNIQDNAHQLHQVITHVGSKIDCNINETEYDTIVSRISESDNTIKSRNVPAVGQLVPGQYWLNTTNRNLYQYTVDFQQRPTPNADRIGQTWIRTTDNYLHRWDGVTWVESGQVNELTELLIKLDIRDLISSTLLSFENKLFQVAAANQPTQKYDYSWLTSSDARRQSYDQHLSDSLYQYCKERNSDPYTNDLFQITDPFTWNYSHVRVADIVYPNDQSIGRWAGATSGIYQLIYSTDVPHLEPWKLQGYVSKPSWWNEHYQDMNGGRRWKYNHSTMVGMWANIMNGVIPAGVRYPSGVMSTGNPVVDNQQLPTYRFVPVNITDNTVGNYAPDSLLPVYVSDPVLSQFAFIRSQQYVDLTKVGDDWTIGDYGPIENKWRQSTEFVYDQLVIAYKMDPILFFFQSNGKPMVELGDLNLDTKTGKVSNHKDTKFHGQFPPNYTQPVRYLGINQWYSNYFRFHDIDITNSNVYHNWTSWDIVGGYATDFMIQSDSVDVFLSCSKMNHSDYSIILKQSRGADTFNIDNLIVSTVAVGTYNITYNAKSPRGYGDDWVYRISTSAPVAKKFQYYGVKRYQANYIGNNKFNIAADHKLKTGDLVRLYSPNTLPVPLNSVDDYFIIVNTDGFQLAHNQSNARLGLAIDILSGTDQTFSIGAVRSTFVPLGGQHTSLSWTTYQPDQDQLLSVDVPFDVTGIQSIVDFVTGYSARLQDVGAKYTNDIVPNMDPITGRQLTWDLELERLIDQIYIGLGTSVNVLKQNQPIITTEFVELNPFRLQCGVIPTTGMISNIFDRGPSYLIGDPMVYNQYGQLFTQDQLFVFRQDRLTTIKLDTRAIPQTDPLNSTHIGGMRLAIDKFEHVILFEPSTTVYNSHLGVEIQSLYMSMRRANERTGRPNVGGYFIHNDHLQENFDTSAVNLSNFYNPHAADDFSGYVDYAQSLVGYVPPDYLDNLRVTDRSKFNFWRGLIQYKGAKSVVASLGNAKQLTGIDMDEFWAYRKATFGSNQSIKDTLDFRIKIDDLNNNRLLTHFPAGHILDLPSPYINVKPNDPNGRYINSIDHQSTFNLLQNYYIEPKLFDVTSSIVTKHNQRQPDGSVATVHYIFTDTSYDTFAIHIERQNQEVYQLVPDVDYQVLGPTACKIIYDITDLKCHAYGVRPNYKLTNLYQLVDTASKTIVSNIPVVAPHHRQYPAQVMLSLDAFNDVDPAKYTESLTVNNLSIEQRWGEERNGTLWVDTGNLYYFTFHDHILTPDINRRLDKWSERVPNTNATVYKWISSPVPPDQWIDYTQSYDDPEGLIVPSGQPMVNLYYRVRADVDSAYGEWLEIKGECTIQQTFAHLTDDLSSNIIPNPFIDDLQLSTSIEVYINGELIGNVAIDPASNVITLPRLPIASDMVTLRLINEQWRTFIQDRHNYQPFSSEADIVEYIAFTPHVITTKYVGVGEFVQPVANYHFWVSNSNDIINTSNVSAQQLESMINDTPTTFAVIDKLIYDPSFTNSSRFKYTSVAISGLDQLVTSDQRFAIRLTINNSLATSDTFNMMTTHSEWEMFREHQSHLIPTVLWNRLVESVIGYRLADPDQPVPSTERVFYDRNNNTMSRYGIRYDQTLGGSKDIIRTIVAIISDPSTDIYPVDKDQFFDKYSFDNNEQTLISLNYIHSYFPVSVINRILVEVLRDFLTLSPNDTNIMKTSWISVSGTTIVDIQQ